MDTIRNLLIAAVMLAVAFAGQACGDEESEPEGKDTATQTDVATEDGTGEVSPGDDEIICTPDCADKTCGEDGCGGSCGTCPAGQPCTAGNCVPCVPQCDGKECGPDTCGGFCGEGPMESMGCPEGDVCDTLTSLCSPPGDCGDKECGPDGAGASCGTCPDGSQCTPDGQCEAVVADDGCCAPIFDCFETCPENDQACAENCLNAAPIECQVAYQALIQCLDLAGYFKCLDDFEEDTPELEACLNEAMDQCMDEYYECFPAGEGTCVDLYLCIIGCPEGEAGQACAQDCFSDASIEALDLWQLFIDCLEANGYFDCPEGDSECYQAAWDMCDTEFKECAHGDYTCQEIFGCQEDCAPTDQICFLQCIVYGSIDAQTTFDEIVDCVLEQCGDNTTPECENQAIEGPCADYYNGCIGM